MSEHIDKTVNRVKRYYLSRNRDHERVLSEVTESAKPFLKFRGSEWVQAEDYDAIHNLLAEAVRMIEGYKRAGWLTNPAAGEQANDFIERATR